MYVRCYRCIVCPKWRNNVRWRLPFVSCSQQCRKRVGYTPWLSMISMIMHHGEERKGTAPKRDEKERPAGRIMINHCRRSTSRAGSDNFFRLLLSYTQWYSPVLLLKLYGARQKLCLMVVNGMSPSIRIPSSPPERGPTAGRRATRCAHPGHRRCAHLTSP